MLLLPHSLWSLSLKAKAFVVVSGLTALLECTVKLQWL